MAATISDIAKEAGVSTATVSRVLTSAAKVNDDTRSRVMDAVKKYHYSPSTIARGLKNKSMKTIAIVVKSFKMLHHMLIADNINAHFSKIGYDTVMFETDTSIDEVSVFLRRMMDKSIDGVVFIGSTFQILRTLPSAELFLASVPVVIANGWVEGCYGILVNEKEGSRILTDHLISRGKRNIVFLHISDTESCRNKIAGSLEASEGIKCNAVRISESQEDIKRIIKVLEPDAIIAEDDLLAAKTMKIILEMNMIIPDDIAVAGFNNSEYSLLTSPSLTSVDNCAIKQGRAAAELLEKILSGAEDAPKEKGIIEVLPASLVVRGSTDKEEK